MATTTSTEGRRRLSADERHAIEQQALGRALSGQSLANYVAIYEGFMSLGIAEEEIEPRVNVFTYHAWRAKGRQVRRGEHGVKILTYAPIGRREKDADGGERIATYRRPVSATVFHVSQTDPIRIEHVAHDGAYVDNSYVVEADDPAQQRRND